MSLHTKLIDQVRTDFPDAKDIVVSYPETWNTLRRVIHDHLIFYIAATDPVAESPRHNRFYGLSSDINRSLTTYRLYHFFRPHPRPIFTTNWNPGKDTGNILELTQQSLQLQTIGHAQAWFGGLHAVIWECFFHAPIPTWPGWKDHLAICWNTVEFDTGAHTILTQPNEPTWETGYDIFLKHLGFNPSSQYPHWWVFYRTSGYPNSLNT